ncbi:MAG: bifunctional riboflavin kinase/FAD synthetase [Candidatus Omnitrophota bacterium]
MKVVYGLTHFKRLHNKPVVALGVFDGLHRGHQGIIAKLIKEAKALYTRSVVITFFPHPQKENIIYSLPHRLKLLEDLGVDLCLVIRFTPSLRKITAQEFLQKILIKKINPAAVLIGKNFTFGKNAQGNWQTLRDYSRKEKFKLFAVKVFSYKGRPISSSWIRALIKGGRFLRAKALLGRPITIFGRVSRGCSFGRILGYPTANIDPDHEVLPPFGVYAVRARWDLKFFNGICYIGNRPTINASKKTNVEVHIFNFKGNLYNRKIEIEFIRRIRPQKKFSSVKALSCQIKRDAALVNKILKQQ